MNNEEGENQILQGKSGNLAKNKTVYVTWDIIFRKDIDRSLK